MIHSGNNSESQKFGQSSLARYKNPKPEIIGSSYFYVIAKGAYGIVYKAFDSEIK